jgi:serine/threonine-protein kinase
MQALIGTTLGEFGVVEILSEDALSVTFRAYQTSARRYVALTVIRPPFLYDVYLQREFQRQVPILRKLAHPNVPPFYLAANLGGWLALAFRIPPATSAAGMAGRPQRLEKVVNIVVQVGNALDQAHGLGLVHAGLNPANVRLGEGERVALVGFGVAALAAASPKLLAEQVTGQWPEYLAPEQVRGYGANVRSDVFALGVLAYHLMFGAPPFPGATPAEVQAQHNQLPPSPRLLNPYVSNHMEEVFRRALAKNAVFRYATVGQLTREFVSAAETMLEVEAARATPMPSPLLLEPRPIGPRTYSVPAVPPPASAEAPPPGPAATAPRGATTTTEAVAVSPAPAVPPTAGFGPALWLGVAAGAAVAFALLLVLSVIALFATGAIRLNR